MDAAMVSRAKELLRENILKSRNLKADFDKFFESVEALFESSLAETEEKLEALRNEIKELNQKHAEKVEEEKSRVQKEIADVLKRILDDEPDLNLREALQVFVNLVEGKKGYIDPETILLKINSRSIA